MGSKIKACIQDAMRVRDIHHNTTRLIFGSLSSCHSCSDVPTLPSAYGMSLVHQRRSLLCRDLVGFPKGQCSPPATGSSATARRWNRVDIFPATADSWGSSVGSVCTGSFCVFPVSTSSSVEATVVVANVFCWRTGIGLGLGTALEGVTHYIQLATYH